MYRNVLIGSLILVCTTLHAQGTGGLPAASDGLPSASSDFDCDASFQQAQSLSDRGLQVAGMKQWAEAQPLLRDASKALMAVVNNCPALQKQASLLDEQVGKVGKQAETSLNHQSNCQPRLDSALELDIKASSGRREKKEPKELETLYAAAENAWRAAVEQCGSPHKEKAERNLNATVKSRAENAEQLSSGPACDSAWKNAGTMVELAKEAWKEKRWDDAAMLHYKAQLAWERAAENCSGTRQATAEKKIEQAQLDAHNAEFCGPQWDESTELSQQMKAKASTSSVAEREIQSIKTEVAWRDAIILCRGAPQSLARNNAEAVARERGLPLPPGAMDKYSKKPKVPAGGEPVAAKPKPVEAVAAKAAAPKAGVEAPRSKDVEAAKPAAVPVEPGKPVEVETVEAGDTVYRGKFLVDPATGKPTGDGKVEWPNGDRYSGAIVDGQRHGKGRFTWKNGQWYEGDWKNDIANGSGVILYTNGNRYEGNVRNGIPQGQGTLVFASEDRYTGQFQNGEFHGQGSYFWKSGSVYVGDWVRGKKEGHGRLTMQDGGGWEGEYRNDEESGTMTRFKAK